MSEAIDARHLADKLLDDHWRDPDADLLMLARQLLRADERCWRLLALAVRVCDFDWSDNDADAVAAIANLREMVGWVRDFRSTLPAITD